MKNGNRKKEKKFEERIEKCEILVELIADISMYVRVKEWLMRNQFCVVYGWRRTWWKRHLFNERLDYIPIWCLGKQRLQDVNQFPRYTNATDEKLWRNKEPKVMHFSWWLFYTWDFLLSCTLVPLGTGYCKKCTE